MSANLERQLALLALLAGAKRPLSQKEITEKLPNFYREEGRRHDSVRKAFARDVDALQSLGAAILSEGDGEGGDGYRYRLMPDEEGLPRDFRLTHGEALRLRTLLESPLVRQQLSGPSCQALANLLTFHAAFDEEARGEENLDEAAARCEKLTACARERRACAIGYPDHQGKPERRDVSSAGIFFRFGLPYCAAICHRSGTIKVFSVVKISEIRLAPATYQPAPEDFNLAAFAIRNAFRLSDHAASVRAEIRVMPEEAWRLKERTPGAVVDEDKSGTVRAAYDVSVPSRFFRFLLGFGEFVEILGPPELKQAFAEHLEASL